MYRRSQKPADHQKEDVAPETKAGEISAEGDTVSRKLKPNKWESWPEKETDQKKTELWSLLNSSPVKDYSDGRERRERPGWVKYVANSSTTQHVQKMNIQ